MENIYDILEVGSTQLNSTMTIVANHLPSEYRHLLDSQTEQFVAMAVGFAILVQPLAVFLFMVHSKGKKAAPKFLDKTRKTVPLIDKVMITHDTYRFRFGLPSKNHSLGLPVGQHITVYAPNKAGVKAGEWNGRPDPEAEEEEIQRKYTPVSSDDDLGYVDLVLKIYKGGLADKPQFPDGGKMSQYLMSLTPGKDSVDISGPSGKMDYQGCGKFIISRKENQKKHIGMMAGGTGITPMLQVVNAALKNPADPTTYSLLFANQTEEDILCREELEQLAKTHPGRFKVHYTLDRPPAGWQYSSGFITPEMIQQHMPAPGPDTLILMCGPPPMVKFACQANLDKLEYPKEMQMAF